MVPSFRSDNSSPRAADTQAEHPFDESEPARPRSKTLANFRGKLIGNKKKPAPGTVDIPPSAFDYQSSMNLAQVKSFTADMSVSPGYILFEVIRLHALLLQHHPQEAVFSHSCNGLSRHLPATSRPFLREILRKGSLRGTMAAHQALLRCFPAHALEMLWQNCRVHVLLMKLWPWNCKKAD